jgi:hypothetical protein
MEKLKRRKISQKRRRAMPLEKTGAVWRVLSGHPKKSGLNASGKNTLYNHKFILYSIKQSGHNSC